MSGTYESVMPARSAGSPSAPKALSSDVIACWTSATVPAAALATSGNLLVMVSTPAPGDRVFVPTPLMREAGLVSATTIKPLAFSRVAAAVQLAITVNPLAAALATLGLLGYVFLYTLWLKPRTPLNIVLGGAAGAMPPLVGWAAATGALSAQALWPFAIVFFWTPPHFWALSLLISDDYARNGVPMLPVVRGEENTRRQILGYSVVLTAVTVGPVITGLFGGIYLVSALVLGIGFIALAATLSRNPSKPAARNLYLSSLAYLALLFIAMAVDRVV